MIEKIQELGADYRVEIRRANIHTFENIMMAHGTMLCNDLWSIILKNVLISLFKNSVDMYV